MNDEISTEIAESVFNARGGQSIEEHADVASEKLADDNIVGFGLVAIREADTGGYQATTHRAVDHETILETDSDPEAAIDEIHDTLVTIFEKEVAEK